MSLFALSEQCFILLSYWGCRFNLQSCRKSSLGFIKLFGNLCEKQSLFICYPNLNYFLFNTLYKKKTRF